MLGCLLQWGSPNDFNTKEFTSTYVLVFVFVVNFEVWSATKSTIIFLFDVGMHIRPELFTHGVKLPLDFI